VATSTIVFQDEVSALIDLERNAYPRYRVRHRQIPQLSQQTQYNNLELRAQLGKFSRSVPFYECEHWQHGRCITAETRGIPNSPSRLRDELSPNLGDGRAGQAAAVVG
jgi:hypothetical protein